MSGDYDLSVIGGGPAGMAAATLAAGYGLKTVLFDEQPAPGGQIYRNIESVTGKRPDDLAIFSDDYRHGHDLAKAFRASSAEYAPESSIWEIRASGTLGVLRAGKARQLRAKRILIAGGSMERPVPIPGWTLPGVMTAGAAQTILKSSGQVPDVPVVLAGSGPLLYLVATELVSAGASLKAILRTTPRNNLWRAARHLPDALVAGNYLWKGLQWMRLLKAAGVPMLGGVTDLRAVGDGTLDGVEFATGERVQRLDAGLLLLHEGIVPNNQLAMSAGCEMTWDEEQFCWRTVTDDWGATSAENIAVAGDCAAIVGALLAEHYGRLAALDAAYRQGAIDGAARGRLAGPERAEITRHKKVRRFLDILYRPARKVLVPPLDDTVICRCEEITAGELRQVVALGCPGPNQAKAFTRAGMGRCQGRMCGLTVAAVIADARKVPVADVGHYRIRPPIKPITVGELASMEGVGRDVPALDGSPNNAERRGPRDRGAKKDLND